MGDRSHSGADGASELGKAARESSDARIFEAASPAASAPPPRPDPTGEELRSRLLSLEAQVASLRDERNQARQRFEALFDHASLGVAMTAPDGELLRINPTFAKLFGYSLEELRGISFAAITHPDDVAESRKLIADLMAGKSETASIEKRYLHKDGSVVWTLVSTRLERDQEGNPEFFLTHVMDITHGQEGEALARRIAAGAPLAMAYLHLDGNFGFFNRRFHETFGFSADDLPDLSSWILRAHPDSSHRQQMLQSWDLSISQALRRGREFDPVEHQVTRSDGKLREIEISGVPLGRGLLVTFLDLTTRREEGQRARTIVDASPLAKCYVRADGKVLYFNRAFHQLVGYDLEDIPDQESWWARAYPDPEYRTWVLDTWSRAYQEALENGSDIAGHEYRVTCKDGSIKVVQIHGVPLGEDFLVTLEDRTEVRRSRERRRFLLGLHEEFPQLGLSEFRERLLDAVSELTESPAAFLHIPESQGRTPGTPGCGAPRESCSVRGFPSHEEEAPGALWRSCQETAGPLLRGPEQGPANEPRHRMAAPVLRGEEVVAVLGVGGRAWAYSQDELDDLAFLAEASFQFLERRRLVEERDRILQAIEETSDGIGMSDADGRHFYQNQALTELLGYSAAELGEVGPISLFAQPESAQEVLDTVLSGGSWKGELEMIHRDGHRLPISLRADAVLDESGDVLAVIGIHRDLTAERRRETELENLNQELLRSNRDLEQFAYVASHDLQEPLRMVASYTQLLSRRYQGQLDERADRFIRFAVEGAQRMQHLIDDLLHYSRVGTQGRPLEPVECSEVLREVLQDLERARQRAGGEVRSEALPRVLADPVQLHQVFLNLVGNALKFGPPGEVRVSLTARPRGDLWEIRVRDNGPGIESRFHERIFQIFQRLQEREASPGNGIGLSVVKRIVERHGGEVGVESPPGAGATFWFTLPAVPPTEESE